MQSAYEIKKEICEIGRRIYMNGFVAANDGNISVKVSDNEFYCTPTGVSKGFMTPDMILKVDAQGNKLEGKLNPSTEIKMHLRVYRERPDVRSVVHAHPPTATAFACANIPLDEMIMPEAILFLGSVPVCAYGTPSTDEIPDSLAPFIQSHDTFLLQNHGALTVGHNLMNAYFHMESLEFYAKVTLLAKQLGGAQELSCGDLEKLMELRRKFNVPGKHPGCKKCDKLGTSECRCKDNAAPAKEAAHVCTCGKHDGGNNDALVAEITRKVLQALGR
ncbi:MAG: class II aldolase/adducin family protein [Clostridia bacterium]|nr:class II aldolase/adducin family protein [Clostridia bacterium]